MFHFLSDQICFPPVEEAAENGLLAIGGDLSTERLLLAYRNGIFPWFHEEEPPMWWSPDPRFVLFPEELRISKSMKQILRKEQFDFRINTDFEAVIRHCKHTVRRGQNGTWITNDIIKAYTELHRLGYVHSAEAWMKDELVGGLYGIKMGKLFFGESMFSLQPNASKFAFIRLVQQLQQEGIVLIDCQVYTPHLESLGARMITRKHFIAYLQQYLDEGSL